MPLNFEHDHNIILFHLKFLENVANRQIILNLENMTTQRK